MAGLQMLINSGGRIRTSDLRVMSPTSYQAALPRDLCSVILALGTIASRCQSRRIVIGYTFYGRERGGFMVIYGRISQPPPSALYKEISSVAIVRSL